MFGVVDRLTLKVIPACEPARGPDLKQRTDTALAYSVTIYTATATVAVNHLVLSNVHVSSLLLRLRPEPFTYRITEAVRRRRSVRSEAG